MAKVKNQSGPGNPKAVPGAPESRVSDDRVRTEAAMSITEAARTMPDEYFKQVPPQSEEG